MQTGDIGPHQGKRIDDAAHGTFLDRGIPCQRRLKKLSCQNTGDQPGGCAAVTGIKDAVGFSQAVKTFAVNQDMFGRVLDGDAHFAETIYCGETVCAL